MSSGRIQKWRVGEVIVTRVLEGEDFEIDPALLFPASRDDVRRLAWLTPRFASADGDLRMAIQAFILDTGTRRIVVDTCIGNNKQRHAPMWNNLQGPFLEDLNAAGYAPDTIDTVVCTHMHVDHVGWNTRWQDNRWVPTFPNARYLFAKQEWDHWHGEVGRHGDTAEFQNEAARMMQTAELLQDSIQPIVEANLHELVDTNYRLADSVWLEPTPGHTPGHVSVRISSNGANAIITGDLMHHPLQCSRPDLSTHVDWNRERSQQTRMDFLRRTADRDILIFGTHFASPSAGRVRTDGSVWSFEV